MAGFFGGKIEKVLMRVVELFLALPVLPLLPFRDVDEVIARANATRFGLSGSVWSGNTQRAADIGGRLECGTVWINQHISIVPHAPISGVKWSGMGAKNGPWGLLGFTEIQSVQIPTV